jgi:hypothetical protein
LLSCPWIFGLAGPAGSREGAILADHRSAAKRLREFADATRSAGGKIKRMPRSAKI